MTFYELLKNIINKLGLAVRIDVQALSDEQKAQVRENIGAVSENTSINGQALSSDITLTADDIGVYVQSEEPADAVEGDIWVDVDAESHLDPEIVIDATLTQSGQAADAKVVGDKIADITVDGSNPDRHAEYFVVMDDGAVALKPEYRGASTRTAYPYSISDKGAGVVGSKNAELPKLLVVPEVVDKKAVCSLATAIFCDNLAIESVVLPEIIDVIPERCFDRCNKLKNVYGTENIKTIGKCAFQSTAISRLKCPELEKIEDISTFQKCGRMVYVDIGNVTTLPDKTFNECTGLNMVKNSSTITSVGKNCFTLTPSLRHAKFISNLTNIGNAAFLCSGVDYDWSTLDGCSFGTDATSLQYNPNDFWSECTITPCENRLPTFLSQSDERWANRNIGNIGITYSDGCGFFTIMYAYCGLHNIALSSVTEFEDIINEINPDLLNTYSVSINTYASFAEGLGLTVEEYTTYDKNVLQTLYDALADGKYAAISLVGGATTLSHIVLAYGINSNGELLIADSAARGKDDNSEPTRYSIPYHLLTAPYYYGNAILNIISL